MTAWFVDNRGERFGPVPEDVLPGLVQSGRVATDATACAEGDHRWIYVTQVPSVAVLFAPLPVTAEQAAHRARMKRQNILTLAGLGVGVFVIALGSAGWEQYVTIPRRAREQRALDEKRQKQLDEEERAHNEYLAKHPPAPPAPFEPKVIEPVLQEPTAPSPPKPLGCKEMSASSVRGVCKAAVKSKLTSPSSAKFPWSEPDPVQAYGASCAYVFSSTVDSKNAFGVRITNSYTCTVDPLKDTISVVFN